MSEMNPANYGLNSHDEINLKNGLISGDTSSIKTISDISSYLSKVYCGSLAVDFNCIEVRK